MKTLLLKLRSRRALLVIAILGLSMIAWRALTPDDVPVVSTARRDVAQTVAAAGHVRPFSRAQLTSSIAGTVDQVAAREGDLVEASQILVVIDEAKAHRSVASARAALRQAEASAKQAARAEEPTAAARLRRAEARLSRATEEYRRVADLHRSGVVSAEQLDMARQSLDLASATREMARRGAAGLDIGGTARRRAEATLEQARDRLSLSLERLARTRIVAPAEGVVLTRDVEPGNTIRQGQILMEIAIRADAQITIKPDERGLALLRPGQTAAATADAFRGQPFPARVVSISPPVDGERGRREVRLAIDDPPAFLRSDMTVSVDIEVARKRAVVAIPAMTVHDPTTETPWVLVLRSGRVARQNVRLGLRGERWIEVMEGLGDGDLVLPLSARGGRIGQRARAHLVDADSL